MRFLYFSVLVGLSLSSQTISATSSNTGNNDSQSTENNSFLKSNTTDLDHAVSEIENILSQNNNSIAAITLLIEKYETVDDLLTGDEEVTINNFTIGSDDIKGIIGNLQDELEYEEKLNSEALAIQDYSKKYPSKKEVSIKTSDLLKGELDLWNDLDDTIDSDSVVIINGVSYNSTSIASMIDSLEDQIDYLDDENLVEIDKNGTLSYVSDDEYNAQVELNEATSTVSELIENNNNTSEDLNQIIDELNLIIGLMNKVNARSVKITGVNFNVYRINDLIQDLQNQTAQLEHNEEVYEETENNNELADDEDFNVEDLLDKWNELLADMVEGVIGNITNATHGLNDAKSEVANLTANILEMINISNSDDQDSDASTSTNTDDEDSETTILSYFDF